MKLDPFKKISVSLLLPPSSCLPFPLSSVGFSPTPPSSLPPFSSLLWHLVLLLPLFSTFSLNPGIGRRPLLQSRSVQMSWLLFFFCTRIRTLEGGWTVQNFAKPGMAYNGSALAVSLRATISLGRFARQVPDSIPAKSSPRGDAQKKTPPPTYPGRLCRLGWFGGWRRDGWTI